MHNTVYALKTFCWLFCSICTIDLLFWHCIWPSCKPVIILHWDTTPWVGYAMQILVDDGTKPMRKHVYSKQHRSGHSMCNVDECKETTDMYQCCALCSLPVFFALCSLHHLEIQDSLEALGTCTMPQPIRRNSSLKGCSSLTILYRKYHSWSCSLQLKQVQVFNAEITMPYLPKKGNRPLTTGMAVTNVRSNHLRKWFLHSL